MATILDSVTQRKPSSVSILGSVQSNIPFLIRAISLYSQNPQGEQGQGELADGVTKMVLSNKGFLSGLWDYQGVINLTMQPSKRVASPSVAYDLCASSDI